MSYIDELFKSGVWGTKEPTEPTWVKWIPRKDTGEMVSYISGWMVQQNGKIKLNTPYGGK